ncbi:MAG: prolyl oligopeptidase family serine peptidase [Planctomycetia bacterium]|nr:prolyl oligopeptidase family serine peptidase [Planctomycetia bacterium]
MFRKGFPLLVFFWPLFLFAADDAPPPPGWNAEVKTVFYTSSADNTEQPALFYAPETSDPVPLLVGLHTWSADYRQPNTYFYHGAKKQGWAMICPNFRGSNTRPEACGSELAVEDIVSAVKYAQSRVAIDPNRIYLMGMSGGGHASMLLAGRHPEIWAGVCSWVGISDLAAWHRSTRQKDLVYWKHLEKACGGAPGTSPEIDEQYRLRSPLTWLENARDVPLCINHGIHDGHTGSVPVSHAIWAFNRLAEPVRRLSDEQIRFFCENRKVPPELAAEVENDPLYGKQTVLFRRSFQNVRLTIFEGGHGGVPNAGIEWLSRQIKGQKADWSVFHAPAAETSETLSGK